MHQTLVQKRSELWGLLGGLRPHKSCFCLRPTLSSQHPSPHVKALCNFEPQIWLEIILSRDWGVAKGSSSSRVAKFQGDRAADWNPSEGRSRSYRVRDMRLSAGTGWSRSCRVTTNQHPNLPWSFTTRGFLSGHLGVSWVMPNVLLLKAQGRHVIWQFVVLLGFL